MAGPGGKRVGAGRPPGAVTSLGRKYSEAYIKSGKLMPIDVMGENMAFFHKEASKVEEQIVALVQQSRAEGRFTLEHMAEVTKLLQILNKARELAQRCAVDLAPYLHPRLAALTVKNEAEKPFRIQVLGSLTFESTEKAPAEAAEKAAEVTEEAVTAALPAIVDAL